MVLRGTGVKESIVYINQNRAQLKNRRKKQNKRAK
jgi:hypothetical protein